MKYNIFATAKDTKGDFFRTDVTIEVFNMRHTDMQYAHITVNDGVTALIRFDELKKIVRAES